MAYNSDVRTQIQIPESGKFVEIVGDSRFPPISVQRTHTGDGSVETAEFSKYAVLTHMVNASDIVVSLSSGDVNIGNVGIVDHTSGTSIYSNVVRTATVSGIEVGALRVLTQDLESNIDDITIGDRLGNMAAVNASLSALRTFTTNPISAVSITNPVTAVTVLNTVSSFSLVNPITAVTVLNPISSFSLVNPVTAVTILNTVSAVSITNPVSSFSLVNPVTSVIVSTNGNTLAVSGTITTIANSYSSPFGDNAALDGFGKLRVTQPKTLFDAKQLTDKLPYVFDEIISGVGAASVWQKGDSMTKMTTSNSGEYVIRQTSMHMNYQPGKSLLGYFTGVFTPQLNVTKRIGLFQGLSSAPYTPTDGIFIESTDGATGYVAFKILKTVGVTYALSAAQPEWNLDRLDGTGRSGLSINLSSAQLLVIDYEWLGVGRIRCGFNIAGKTIYAHEFIHTNGLLAPYMTSGNQPIRYEIRQTGSGSGFLNHICSSVMSEGGEEYIGTSLTADLTGVNGVNLITASYRPLLAVRLNPDSHDLSVVLKTLNILNTGTATAMYKVIMNPTITNGSLNFVNLASNPNVQSAQGSSTLGLSGGYELTTGYAFKGADKSAQGGTGPNQLLGELAILGTRINGTPDVFVIAAKGVEGATDGVFAAVDMILRG